MPASRLKPFIHWVIYKGYKVRYTKHSATLVTGILTSETDAVHFEYDPSAQLITLPDEQIVINEHGWEVNPNQGESDQETGIE